MPAFVAVGLIVFGIEEPTGDGTSRRFRSPLHWGALREFPARYWLVVALGATFTLTRFSEAFLVLRAQQTGLNIAWIPGVMVVVSLTYSLSAYPAGALSDHMDRRILLACGLLLLIAADLILGGRRSSPCLSASPCGVCI